MALKFTRRQLTAALLAAPAIAQQPAPTAPATPGPAAPLDEALDYIRKNADAIKKVQLEMAVEPSFAFRP